MMFLLIIPHQIYSKYKEQPLDGIAIVLDAGHGGKDLGASNHGISEEHINLNIVLALKQYLEKEGASITLTRKNHDALNQEKNWKSKDMKKRVMIMNEEAHDLMISIHLNSFEHVNVKGSQVFYNYDELLASSVDEQLKDLTHSKLKIKKGDYYILNECKLPSLLIECGFLSNDEECELLNDSKYQKQIAKAISKGIMQYFKQLNYN